MDLDVLSVAVGRPGPTAFSRTIHAVASSWTHLAALPIPADAGPSILSVVMHVRSGRVGVAILSRGGDVIEEREVGVGSATCWFAIPAASDASQLVVRTRDIDDDSPIVVTISDVSMDPVGSSSDDDEFLSVFAVDQRAANFSFVPHLLASEAARRAAGTTRMRLLVIEESSLGAAALPRDFSRAYPKESRDRFVHGDIPAIAALMPSVTDVAVVPDSEDARRSVLVAMHRYPDNPSASGTTAASDFAKAFGSAELASADARLSAGRGARAEVRDWLDRVCPAAPVVTFTPRIADYAVEMNTDVAPWAAWAASASNWCVVIVPDFRQGAPPCPDGPWVTFPFRSPEALVALYECAAANLAMYGEVALLLMATAAPFTMWVEVREGAEYSSAKALAAMGLRPDQVPAMLLPDQQVFFGKPDAASMALAAAASDPEQAFGK